MTPPRKRTTSAGLAALLAATSALPLFSAQTRIRTPPEKVIEFSADLGSGGPEGIVYDDQNERFFLADGARIFRTNKRGRRIEEHARIKGAWIRGLAMTPQRELVALDAKNSRLYFVDPEGEVTGGMALPESEEYRAVSLSPDGEQVLLSQRDLILVLSRNGEVVDTIVLAGRDIQGLAVAGEGYLWIADKTESDSVLLIDSSGQVHRSLILQRATRRYGCEGLWFDRKKEVLYIAFDETEACVGLDMSKVRPVPPKPPGQRDDDPRGRAEREGLLAIGVYQIKKRDFESALATFTSLAEKEPRNRVASFYLAQLSELSRRLGGFDPARVPGSPGGSTRGMKVHPVRAKLDATKIPEVNFRDLPLSRVVEILQSLSSENDPGAAGEEGVKGVNIALPSRGAPEPRVSITLRNLPLGRALDYIVQQINYRYDIIDGSVVLAPAPPDHHSHLETRLFFPVSQATLQHLTGASAGNDAGIEARLVDAFERSGIKYSAQAHAELKLARLTPSEHIITVTQSQRNLRGIAFILKKYWDGEELGRDRQ